MLGSGVPENYCTHHPFRIKTIPADRAGMVALRSRHLADSQTLLHEDCFTQVPSHGLHPADRITKNCSRKLCSLKLGSRRPSLTSLVKRGNGRVTRKVCGRHLNLRSGDGRILCGGHVHPGVCQALTRFCSTRFDRHTISI